MKIIDAIREAISNNRQFFGVEFFPPHMEGGRLKLYDAMERLFQTGPLFCGITWGDRGSTARETIEICDAAQRLAPVLMQAHITGAGCTEAQMLEWLHELKRRDVTNLFLLRGVHLPRVGRANFGCNNNNNTARKFQLSRATATTTNSSGEPSYPDSPLTSGSNTAGFGKVSLPSNSTSLQAAATASGGKNNSNAAQQQQVQPDDEPFDHAVDLVRFVRKHFGDHFGITVAAYPEGHTEGEDRAAAIRHLKEKVDAGADLVLCHSVFDAKTFLRFCEDCRSAGVTCPIIPGIVPVYGANQLKRMANLRRLNGMDVLEERIRKEAGASTDDDEAVRAVVVDFTAQLVRQLFRAGVRGVYFMTQNIDSVTRKVVAQVSELASSGSLMASIVASGLGGGNASASPLLSSGINNNNFSSSSAAAGGAATSAAAQQCGGGGGSLVGDRPLPWRPSLRVSESARPIYWSSRPSSYLAALEGIARFDDQHPNGRWSSANSPAFGEESTYQHVTALVNATARLCTAFMQVKTVHDVAAAFVGFLSGQKGSSLPWSCVEGLAPESNALIADVLLPMNRRGLLTINSQPAVNGASSEDPTYGWGPKGGYVYQKQYLEFFCSPSTLDTVLSVLDQCPSVIYLAQTADRRCRRSNMPNAAAWIEMGKRGGSGGKKGSGSGSGTTSRGENINQNNTSNGSNNNNCGSNSENRQQQGLLQQPQPPELDPGFMHAAVTWGVFPSQDIQQPTFVSSSAFDLWTPEAFAMWLYPFHGDDGSNNSSNSHHNNNHQQRVPQVVQDICDSWYLVTALDNDYIASPTPINGAIARLCQSLPEL